MPQVRKFVHDENVRNFKDKLGKETDPKKIGRLRELLREEEERYSAALRDDPT